MKDFFRSILIIVFIFTFLSGNGQDVYLANEIKEFDGFVSVYLPDLAVSQIIIEEEESPKSIDRINVISGVESVTVYENLFMASDHTYPSRFIGISIPPNERVSEIQIFLSPGVENPIKSVRTSSLKMIDVLSQIDLQDYPIFWEFFPESQKEPIKAINTTYGENKPIVTPDNRNLYFVRESAPSNKGGIRDYQDIYVSRNETGDNWSEAENLGRPLNNSDANGICSVSPDGNIIYIINNYGGRTSGLAYSKKGKNEYDLPLSVPITNYFNENEYADFFVHPNGEIMILAIETEESKGDQDLYISFNELGIWSAPVNLGDVINTDQAEYAPFLTPDLEYLFFSSYGHMGIGKGDIYVTARLDDTWKNWSKPINMGPHVNSKESDGYFTLSASGEDCYFVSESQETSSFDIFRLKLPAYINPGKAVIIEGIVRDTLTQVPVKATIVYECNENKIYRGKIFSEPGNGTFQAVLVGNYSYKFWAVAEGYIGNSGNRYIPDSVQFRQSTIEMTPIEVGQVFKLEDIYFKVGTTELLEESYPELNRWVLTLKENKNIKIEVQGHTDYVGDASKNMDLSKQRAEKIKNYLVQMGVNKDQVRTRGYGGTRPIVKTNSSEKRLVNRRVEIEIVAYKGVDAKK